MSTVKSADGTVIDYDRYGDGGPVVIFVAGATQFRQIDSGTDETARSLAAEGFTTVVYDRRGRGASGDTTPWSTAREVEDVAALLAVLGDAAALYTSSSGAAIGLAAVTGGLPVTALALYEPPFFAGNDLDGRIGELRTMVEEDRYDDALRHNLRSVIGVPAEMVDGMARAPFWPAMVSVAPTIVYDLSSVNDINVDPDWALRWSPVTVPTTVYSGDQTFPGMPEAADAVAAAIPGAGRAVLAGQGHAPSAEAIVPVLAGFLRDR